jgi:hypothetical protein
LGDAVDTPQHLSFYLFTLQQLAFPASLFSLFADNEDQAVLTINAAALPEICKAVFRWGCVRLLCLYKYNRQPV